MTCLRSFRLFFQPWPLRLIARFGQASPELVCDSRNSQKHAEPKLSHQHREFEISYFPILMTMIDCSLVKALETKIPAKPYQGPYPTETEAQ